MKSILEIIPARGHSKSVPRKNIRPLILPLHETLTIDTLGDWAEAERCLQELQG